MIVIRFTGGLGNHLFQYALGRHLSLIHDRPLRFDISAYESVKADLKTGARVFSLSAFNVCGQPATPEELKDFLIYRTPGTRGRIARMANRLAPLEGRRYVEEPRKQYWHFSRTMLTSRLAQPVCLVGNWQTERYFLDIAEVIRAELALRYPAERQNAEMLSLIASQESVAVHVRHTDNLIRARKEGFFVLPVEYYHEAAALIRQKLGQAQFYVFSDDPAWAKEVLRLPGPTTFVEHNGDERNYEDLRLISACKHHIVGNSTFSWWGAWLGKKDGQIVYAPREYHLYLNGDYGDYYPAGWNLLPAS